MNALPTGEIRPAKRGRKRTVLVVAFLLVAVIGGVVWVTWPREPSYNGKPLSHWLTRYEDLGPIRIDTEDPKEIECRDAIRHIGTNALPHLLRMLQANDSALKSKLTFLARMHGPASFKITTAYELNEKAAGGFRCLGELATSSIPALVYIYTNGPSEYSKDAADSALKALYPASGGVVPRLVPPEERAEWFSDAGRMHMQLGAGSNAILAFSDAIKLNPTNADMYLNRAVARTDIQDFAGALPDITKTLGLNSSNLGALKLSGFCKLRLHDLQGADDDFTTAIHLRTNDFNIYNYRGLARANLRKFDEALADFNAAIDLEAADSEAYRNRASVEAMQKEYELAIEDASKAIELDGHDHVAYQVRGQISNALKDHKSAFQDFDAAIKLNPKDPNNYAGRGTASMCLDDFKAAGADLEKALQLDPKNVAAHAVRGFLKAKRGDGNSEALADLERAAELGPQIPDTHALLGLFQYRCHQWEPALKNCRKALEMGAREGKADLQAGIWLIRAQTGEEAEANRELETYLQSPHGSKTNDWEVSVVRFLSGSLTESNFLGQATTTARRPSAVKGQVCDSLYYAGMKHKIAGDQHGALEFFQKCVDTQDKNNLAYLNAITEMRGLTNK